MPPDTIIPPFSVYGGRPAQYIAELPESIETVHREFAVNYYNVFQEYKGSADVARAAHQATATRSAAPSDVSVRTPAGSQRQQQAASQAAAEVRGADGQV